MQKNNGTIPQKKRKKNTKNIRRYSSKNIEKMQKTYGIIPQKKH
jgi:hypothetical protein